MVVCIAPVSKFRDYIFRSGATHGKDHIFRSLGYNQNHSEELASLYEQQATVLYEAGDYSMGRLNEFGQRITIRIQLDGIGLYTGKTSYLLTGWMLQSDGSITLNTPFAGFSR